jgi:hypothetical protein
MGLVSDDAVSGFNQFLEDQKKIGDANLTLIWFNHDFYLWHEGRLSAMEPLKKWPVGGMTAIRDAIGKTFAHVQDRFSREKPEKVVLAILTDGYENSSHEYSEETIKNLITEHQSKYGWTIIYLAADQDAWASAQQLGILRKNAFDYSSMDTRRGFATYSATVSSSRT